MQSTETVQHHPHHTAQTTVTPKAPDTAHCTQPADQAPKKQQPTAGSCADIQLSAILSGPEKTHSHESPHEDAPVLQEEGVLDSGVLRDVCDVSAAVPSDDTAGVDGTAEVNRRSGSPGTVPNPDGQVEAVHAAGFEEELPTTAVAGSLFCECGCEMAGGDGKKQEEEESESKEDGDKESPQLLDDSRMRMQSFVHGCAAGGEDCDDDEDEDEYKEFEREISSIQQRFAECELQEQQPQQHGRALQELRCALQAAKEEEEEAARSSGSSGCSDDASSLDMYSSNVLNHAYGKLQSLAPKRMVEEMKLALHEVPEYYATGPQCAKVLSNAGDKLTMLDMVVMQYMLNGGIVMRQAHDTDEEHHIEIGAGEMPSEGKSSVPEGSACNDCTTVPEALHAPTKATYSCADEVD